VDSLIVNRKKYLNYVKGMDFVMVRVVEVAVRYPIRKKEEFVLLNV
jgi:hypothetical protein